MLVRTLLSMVLAGILALPLAAGPSPAQVRLEQLYDALAGAEEDEWQVIEDEIRTLWADSHSASMNLLLQRGRAALAADEIDAAIEHLTALTDHAPDFAEGWNARATAYFQAGLYGPAMADIRRVLSLEPRHFAALAGLGLILEDMGKPELALQAYHQVQQIHPNRPDVAEAIARVEQTLGIGDV